MKNFSKGQLFKILVKEGQTHNFDGAIVRVCNDAPSTARDVLIKIVEPSVKMSLRTRGTGGYTQSKWLIPILQENYGVEDD